MRKELILFCLILTLGAFLRLYRLPSTMQFFGDQGRDALIAYSILIDHNPAFIGPVTSVGNMYLGPLYYYFMVVPLMLSFPSPVGPAIAVALLGIATLALIYILGKKMLSSQAAFFALFLYAINPVVITNVRFSWNPNIVPFFSLLTLWTVEKTFEKKYWYWAWTGLLCALLFSLHYISLAYIGTIGLLWMWQLGVQVRSGHYRKDFFMATGVAICIFLGSLLPLVLFDFKHDFLNARAFLSFFMPKSAGEKHFHALSDIAGLSTSYISMIMRLFIEGFTMSALTFAQKCLAGIVLLYFFIKSILHAHSEHLRGSVTRIAYFFFACCAILSLYSSSVFDHYLGFLFPIAALLFGYILSSLWSSRIYKPLVIGVLCVFSFFSYKNFPGFFKLGGTIYELENVADTIGSHMQNGQTYNLLAYSPSKDMQAMNIRYFLTAKGHPLANPDDWTSFERLIIVDEERRPTPFDETQYVIKIWPNRKVLDSFFTKTGTHVTIIGR